MPNYTVPDRSYATRLVGQGYQNQYVGKGYQNQYVGKGYQNQYVGQRPALSAGTGGGFQPSQATGGYSGLLSRLNTFMSGSQSPQFGGGRTSLSPQFGGGRTSLSPQFGGGRTSLSPQFGSFYSSPRIPPWLQAAQRWGFSPMDNNSVTSPEDQQYGNWWAAGADGIPVWGARLGYPV